MNCLNQVGKILGEFSLTGAAPNMESIPLVRNIHQHLESGEPLVFILPAFPAKSPSRDKTNSELPDFGEVLALQNLQAFCDRISEVTHQKVELVICSDGRVFSDVVNVADHSIDRYNSGIQSIISEYKLHSLCIFQMDQLYPAMPPHELRRLLLDVYAASLEQVKELVHTNVGYKNLFNGVHRFLSEDEMSINRDLSRSSAQKITKERAYELLRRSDAWSSLLNSHFPRALRLSIHPHALGHEKFGIKLVPSSNKWATPWHNVAVKIENCFQLMHRREALNLNATLRMERDKYAYFEVAAV